MTEIYLLEQLDAFARCGTLSKAAEELHISQPALSRSMKKLEDELGVSLFHREKAKISLNDTGQLAASLAKSLLDQHAAMYQRIVAFDRSRHSIVVGSCAPYPILAMMPLLQNHFGDMTITSELVQEDTLIAGLKDRRFQIAVLRENPADPALYCQRYMDERLYIAVPEGHPLSAREKVRFSDLAGERFLLQAHVGFWMDVVRKHLPDSSLLVQASADALTDLVEGTDYPTFLSDRMIASGRAIIARVSIPILDDDAHATYYIACRSSERKRYAALFSSVRSAALDTDRAF